MLNSRAEIGDCEQPLNHQRTIRCHLLFCTKNLFGVIMGCKSLIAIEREVMQANSNEFFPATGGNYLCSGSRLLRARRFLGYSAEEAARNLEIETSQLLDLEKTSTQITGELLVRLAKLYGRPHAWLTNESPTREHLNDVSVSPAPNFTSQDHNEFLEFLQVVESRTQEPNEDEKLRELSSVFVRHNSVEALHNELNTFESSIKTGRVDILDAVSRLGVTLILRPLKDVIGTLLKLERGSGLMLSVFQSARLLRTASACALSILLYATRKEESLNYRYLYKLTAESLPSSPDDENFVSVLDLLLPNFLLASLQVRQKWSNRDMEDPANIYQASLRLGASYQATVYAYERLGCYTSSDSRRLVKIKLSDIKRTLLEGINPKNLDDIDVWCLSEDKEEYAIQANRGDLFAFRLRENGSAGYAWDFEALEEKGFAILDDKSEIVDRERIGTPSLRKVVAKPPEIETGEFLLDETCPFPREITRSNMMNISYTREAEPREGILRNYTRHHGN